MPSLPPFPEDLGGFSWDDRSHERPSWSSESDLFNDPLPPELWEPPPEFDEPTWSSGQFWPDETIDEWPPEADQWDTEPDPDGWNPDLVHDEPPPQSEKKTKRGRRKARWEPRGVFSSKADGSCGFGAIHNDL